MSKGPPKRVEALPELVQFRRHGGHARGTSAIRRVWKPASARQAAARTLPRNHRKTRVGGQGMDDLHVGDHEAELSTFCSTCFADSAGPLQFTFGFQRSKPLSWPKQPQ